MRVCVSLCVWARVCVPVSVRVRARMRVRVETGRALQQCCVCVITHLGAVLANSFRSGTHVPAMSISPQRDEAEHFTALTLCQGMFEYFTFLNS